MAENIPDPPETLVTCLACGGDHEKLYSKADGTYAMSRCAWCTHGAMTAKQVAKWGWHRRGR